MSQCVAIYGSFVCVKVLSCLGIFKGMSQFCGRGFRISSYLNGWYGCRNTLAPRYSCGKARQISLRFAAIERSGAWMPRRGLKDAAARIVMIRYFCLDTEINVVYWQVYQKFLSCSDVFCRNTCPLVCAFIGLLPLHIWQYLSSNDIFRNVSGVFD